MVERQEIRKAKRRGGRAPRSLLGALAALTIALPSTGFALVTLSGDESAEEVSFDLFTPASIDPDLAARIAEKARERGIRFTPPGATTSNSSERMVTVAVRIDSSDAAQAISVRSAAEAVPGRGAGITGVQANRFNLGTARGYQNFARTPAADTPVSGRTVAPSALRDIGMPDLADFAPAQPKREDRPSRLQPRIELEDERVAGRSVNTLDATAAQTVDLGGSFRLSPNLDVTAGVRYSQERDRLDPLTNSVQDSQAVYVGTQIRF